jgi:CMP-N,N'-diacetyllegionaminic acid synthase
MKVLGLIPAVGGSRSAVAQNFRLLAGKPLLAYAAETARAASRLSRVVLSTSDEEVAETGRHYGIETLPRAPEATSLESAAKDALQRLEKSGESFDAVCILDPRSPFGSPEDIDRCIELLERSGADSAATVVPVPREYHPHTVYLQAPDGSLHPVAGADNGGDLPPALRRDGAVVVVRRDVLMNGHGPYGERVAGYKVDPAGRIRLDGPETWGQAERIARLGAHRAAGARITPLAGPRRNLGANWAATPIADPLVGAGVGLRREGALGASGITRGQYLEPVRKALQPRCRESATPFLVRDALLLAERDTVTHGFLGASPAALVLPAARAGAKPVALRIEDPFRPHAELLPDIRTSEKPLASALAARALGASGLEREREPGKRELAAGSHVREVAAPIALTALLGKGAGRVRPEQPFKVQVGQLGRPPKGRPHPLTMPGLPPDLVPFQVARPLEPASHGLRAHEKLIFTPACRRDGRLLPRPASRKSTEVEVLNTHAASLPGDLRLKYGNPLAGAPPAALRGRTRQCTAAWLAESWQLFGHESTVVVLGSGQSRAQGVAWPTAKTFQFAHPPERPARRGAAEKIDRRATEPFPLRAATLPASAALKTRLQRAVAAKLPAQPFRDAAKTRVSAAAVAGGFQGTGEPVSRPSHDATLKAALMPSGVFHYIEIEDHEDWATWKRAPHYHGTLALPASPCCLRAHAKMDPGGYSPIFAGPYAGATPYARVVGEMSPPHAVVVGEGHTGLLAMDFAAIAEADSSRWRFSLKKTAGFFG